MLKKHGNLNAYVVRDEGGGCTLLECVQWYQPEDLGDGLMATRQGQKLWVANYFVRAMPNVGVRYVVKDDHTLGYLYYAQPTLMGVLFGSAIKGGHDSKNGPVSILPGHTKLRPATVEDFATFRVQVPPDFPVSQDH
ncbi:hypothetical protein [Novimethylophilus kurashikiensis]|uniref:hypothetical protein n=1 Tax=Novimethylophilus kurashikiensis TaxID=1825523 RepID=UPI0011B1E8D0|nr:hypothetical protein [Novimethylophilus kurashikiensis]